MSRDILAETLQQPVGERYNFLAGIAFNETGMDFFGNEIGGDSVNFPDLETLLYHDEVKPDVYRIIPQIDASMLIVRYGDSHYMTPYFPYDGGEDSPSDYVDMGQLEAVSREQVSLWFYSLIKTIEQQRKELGIEI